MPIIAYGGAGPGDPAVAAYAEAGVTWWLRVSLSSPRALNSAAAGTDTQDGTPAAEPIQRGDLDAVSHAPC